MLSIVKSFCFIKTDFSVFKANNHMNIMKYVNLIFLLLLITFSNAMRTYQSSESYVIRPKGSSNLCMDVYNNGVDYQVYPCHGNKNQTWRILYNPEDQTYTFFSNEITNHVMSVQHGWHDDKRPLMNYAYHTNPTVTHQRFCLEKAGDGYYKMIAKHSKKCMTPEGLSSGNKFWQMPCTPDTTVSIQSPMNTNANLPGAQNKCTFGEPLPTPVPAPAPIYVPVPAPAPIYVPVPAPAQPPIYVPVPAPAQPPIYIPVPGPAPILSYFSFGSPVNYLTFPLTYFNGIWNVDGLVCKGAAVNVQITFNGFSATVTRGNECYTIGSPLIIGKLPTQLDNKTSNSVTFYSSPNQTLNVWLSIVGPNTFAISKFNLIFFRNLC